MEKINVLGIFIDPVTYKKCLDKIDELIQGSRTCQIVTINPEYVVKSRKNSSLRRIANKAALVVTDGVGIIWAAKFLSLKQSKNVVLRTFRSFFQAGYTILALLFRKKYLYTVLPERTTGGDLLLKIAEHATGKGYKIFLFGGEAGTAESVKEKLETDYRGIKIVGTEAGYDYDTSEIISKINNSQAQILFVAFGTPLQEEWIKENLHKLNTVKVAMGVGGGFEHATGKQRRAPKIVQKIHLEWLWRLITQPRKMIMRVWNAVPRFIWIVVKWKIVSK